MCPAQISLSSKRQSKMFYRTWLDYLPEEIHQLIWKMAKKDVMESIVLFGRYKTMFRLVLTGPKIDKISKMPRISCAGIFNNALFDNGEKCDYYTSWKINRWITNGLLEIEKSACGILKIKHICQLYQLCKQVDNDWNNLGFIENTSATRYTYDEYSDLDNALNAFN